MLLDVAPRIGLDLIAGATLLIVANVEHLALVTPEQRHDLVDDVTAALSTSRSDRREILGSGALQHASSGARLADHQRRQFATPAVYARPLDGIDCVLVPAVGVFPLRDIAALVQNPPPRHEARLAQSHGGITEVLRGRAGTFFAVSVAVGFRDDALLLQLIEQEPTIGRDGTFTLVLLQQVEAGALQPSRLALRLGEQRVLAAVLAHGRGPVQAAATSSFLVPWIVLRAVPSSLLGVLRHSLPTLSAS